MKPAPPNTIAFDVPAIAYRRPVVAREFAPTLVPPGSPRNFGRGSAAVWPMMLTTPADPLEAVNQRSGLSKIDESRDNWNEPTATGLQDHRSHHERVRSNGL